MSKHLGNLRYSIWNKMLNIAPYSQSESECVCVRVCGCVCVCEGK